ncbi:MAG: hypothetical protein J6V01_08365, partial [Clostridia bacterium]|nr:hypothetical protein [Clostridia bacterium]
VKGAGAGGVWGIVRRLAASRGIYFDFNLHLEHVKGAGGACHRLPAGQHHCAESAHHLSEGQHHCAEGTHHFPARPLFI